MDTSKGEITETAHLSHGNWPESNADSIGHERALQILSTEHWSLLSQRSLAYNESLTRVGMFLTVLSMSFVALAFFAQATGFTPDYLVLVVIIACFNLFVGLATFVRIVGTWIIEGQAIQGMNRIRHAYTEISPGVTKYFVAGIHDDPKGIAQTFGAVPDRSRLTSALYGLSTALGMVAIITAFVAAGLVALVAVLAGVSLGVGLTAGAVGFIVVLATEGAFAARALRSSMLPTEFPSGADAR